MHIDHLQAQLLAEMDEEFGISNLVEEEFGSVSRPRQPVSLTKVCLVQAVDIFLLTFLDVQ